ncbi:U3 small nucleolar RNA-interacting protein 2-like isoform X1 [Rhopilema esculentum]|uniref:U3 small nucleolar RNA-interacting protein 2-like isoform X1 n=1 Tax=Rhopilema esculentum TaxID=499914 RepID=UPI0031DED3BD
MPGFFLKRKSKSTGAGLKKRKPTPAKNEKDDEIGSDSDIASESEQGNDDLESDSSIEETAQEKRLRLAKDYIAKLEREESQKALDDQVDRDAIAHRLQEDVLSEKGILQKQLAEKFSGYDDASKKCFKGHRLSVTCVAVSSDDNYIFSGSKDGYIIKWSIRTWKRELQVDCPQNSSTPKKKGSKSQKNHLLCLALSSDGKYLASGGKEHVIHIWNAHDLTFIRTFTGHKNSITGLAFRKGTHQLFSASMDRSVKVWSLDEMAYIETLFGHEDAITGIDSLAKDRAVTCGGRDRTVRLWKIPEESQLVFRAHNAPSIDCVAMINEEYYLTGADNGSISVWNLHKKKPVCTVRNAHQIKKSATSQDKPCNEAWITSVAALKNSDLVASAGSCDSCIRVWKCEQGFRSLQQLFAIPVTGFVNALQFSENGDFIIAGIGQEHRLGRWWRLKDAKNSIIYIPFTKT